MPVGEYVMPENGIGSLSTRAESEGGDSIVQVMTTSMKTPSQMVLLADREILTLEVVVFAGLGLQTQFR